MSGYFWEPANPERWSEYDALRHRGCGGSVWLDDAYRCKNCGQRWTYARIASVRARELAATFEGGRNPRWHGELLVWVIESNPWGSESKYTRCLPMESLNSDGTIDERPNCIWEPFVET